MCHANTCVDTSMQVCVHVLGVCCDMFSCMNGVQVYVCGCTCLHVHACLHVSVQVLAS